LNATAQLIGGAQNVEEAKARDALLRYLVRNPDAADTLGGIVKWWLTDMKGETSEEDVKHVLEQLEDEGLVQKTVLAEGTVLYSRMRHTTHG
jgi:Fe2+ or Zn2+ uptake regulation protein